MIDQGESWSGYERRAKDRERRFGLGRRIRPDRRSPVAVAVAFERRSGLSRRVSQDRRRSRFSISSSPSYRD